MTFSEKAGFGIGEGHVYRIPAGQRTAVEAVLDLERPFAFLIIACPDTSKAAASSNTLSIRVSHDIDGPMYELNDDEGAALAPEIGSGGTFWRRYFVGAARRVQIVISANVANVAGLEFVIIGVDAGAQ